LYFIHPLELFDCEVYQVSIHGFGVCVHTQLCVFVCARTHVHVAGLGNKVVIRSNSQTLVLYVVK